MSHDPALPGDALTPTDGESPADGETPLDAATPPDVPNPDALGLPVVADWFSVTWVTGSIAMLTEPHVDDLLRANLWYVRGRERDLLVDTGNGAAPLRPVLARFARGRTRETIAVATTSVCGSFKMTFFRAFWAKSFRKLGSARTAAFRIR